MTTDRWRIGQKETGVVCEYVTGRQRGSQPRVPCFYDGWEEEESEESAEKEDAEDERNANQDYREKLTAEIFWREI